MNKYRRVRRCSSHTSYFQIRLFIVDKGYKDVDVILFTIRVPISALLLVC